MEDIRTQIKLALVQNKTSLTKLHELLIKEYGQDAIGSLQNLSSKINRNTLKYNEALQIAYVLGFTITWKIKENKNKYGINMDGYISPF